MNKINFFARKMLSGAVAVAMLALATHALADSVPQTVTVVKVSGNARYSTDNGTTWTKIKRGDVIPTGSTIETAEKSSVDLLMGEKQGPILAEPVGAKPINPTAGALGGDEEIGPKANIVRVFPSSVLAIDKLTLDKTGADEVSETQLDLRAGQIMGNVKKLSAASRYEVKIPNGVAGIRGTSYLVSATGVIYVLTGQVIVSYIVNGQVITATISAGQEFNPFNPDGTPSTSPTTAPIPPNILTVLQNNVNDITAPTYQYTKGPPSNPTVINISAD